MAVPHFTEQALKFLRGLKRNNNREWFEPRKATYEKLTAKFLQNGWIIYSNPANNNAPVVGSVLRVQAAFTGSVPDTFVPNSGISEVTYNREGFATTAAGFPNTLFTLHDQTAKKLYTRCLWLTPIGLASIQTNLNNFSGMLCQ